MSNSKDIEKQLDIDKAKAKGNPELIKAIEEKQQYINKPIIKK